MDGSARGPLALLKRLGLRLASIPYGIAVGMRNLAYDVGVFPHEKVAVPVISVGNLTVGGTGKTPCVEYLARFYRQRDCRVALLSRGYGAAAGRNDEAMVLEENLPDVPHLQGGDRVSLARAAMEELESEILILDDGFQHRRLDRTLDIVLIDATNPWGHGHILPRGLLRESPRGLRRAHVVMLTRTDQVSQGDLETLRLDVRRRAPKALLVEAIHRPLDLVNGDRTENLLRLRDRPVLAFCGLGHPGAFRRTLEGLAAQVLGFRTFPDHHPYSREDVDQLRAWASGYPSDCPVVTTQKDLVKLRLGDLAGRPLWALKIGLEITAGEDRLRHFLEDAASARQG